MKAGKEVEFQSVPGSAEVGQNLLPFNGLSSIRGLLYDLTPCLPGLQQPEVMPGHALLMEAEEAA